MNVAASICPTWDLSSGSIIFNKRHPWIDWYLARRLVNYFIKKPQNQNVIAKISKEIISKVEKCISIRDFMDFGAPLAGCRDLEHWLQENNPMNFFQG